MQQSIITLVDGMIKLLLVNWACNDLPHAAGLYSSSDTRSHVVARFDHGSIYDLQSEIEQALMEMEKEFGPEHPKVKAARDVTMQVMHLALYTEAEVIVAKSQDGEALGYAIISALEPSKAFGDTKSLYLAALVNTSATPGVGREIVLEASRLAKQRDISRLSVASETDIIPYYEKLGFIHSNPRDFRDMILVIS